MRRLLQRKLCRRKTLLFTLFLLSLIIGTTPASAKEVTDVLTNAGLINSITPDYTKFHGKSFTSDAVYAGKIAGTNGTIQLNKTKSNNIVTTASGGTLKKIKVFWNSNTSKNSLQVYAQNSPYAVSTELSGTALGTLAYSAAITGSDGKKYTEYTFTEGSTYTYVAIGGGGGATYSDSIEITWEDGTAPDTRQDVTLSWSESAVSANLGETFTAPTLTVNPADATSLLVYSSSDKSVAEIAKDGTVTIKAVGQTTITATIPDENKTYKPISASYTLTVIDPNEVYYLVKSLDDFDVTQECILVAYKAKSYQAAMGAQGSGNYRSAVSYSSIDASLPEVLLAPAGTVPFTLEPVADSSTYYIKVGENTYLSISNSGSNTNEETQTLSATAIDLSFNDNRATLKYSGVDGTRALGYNNSTNPKRFASYTATDATYNKVYLYQKRSATPALGDITFDPAPGSEVPINSTVKISCKNATQISYSITKNSASQAPVVVTGSVAEVTITEDCIIEAKCTNDEGDSKIADADYYVQEPFTLYTDFYEETGTPYIPDGDYVLVGSVSSGESAGEYYMAEQKNDYRVANKIQPLEDGRLPIDNKYQINIKKEDSGNYSLTTADGKYIYAVSSTKTSGEGESQTTTTTYSVKEGDETAGLGKWKANIKNGKVYFSWAEDESYGHFKFNPQSPRFKTYDPASNSMVSFSLYSTNIPLCRDLKFDHEDGSTVVRGSTVTISCINAAKIFYSVDSPSNVKVVEGNKASVIISDDCLITAYAENAAGDRSGDDITARYTVIDPYVQFTGYGSDGSVPDGKYLFVGQNATTGALSYMAESDIDSNGSTYRNAVEVTPFEDGRIGVSDKYAITVKKEEGANYSLITADGKYLYASTFTPTSGEGESQTTTTTYSVIGGDADQGQGQWTANVAENKVEFAWSNPDMGTLRFNSGASRFKTYVGNTGTKFYLYAPTPKPAQVVCTDATITNEEIHIAVKKTITFKSEGAGKMACKVLDNSVETFDIVDGYTYTFTAASEPTDQIITIIPYDQYGAAYEPSELVVLVHTHDVPTISYNLLEDENKVKFIATNGEISEIRPYRIDGTLADAVSYANNTADIAFSNPRYKVSAKNTFGDTVEESFNFINVLSEREGVESPYSAYLVYKNATGTTYERNEAVFELDKAVDSFTYSMEGVLLKGNDLKNDYPFLLEDYTISLHVSWLLADSPIFLQAKDNTGSEAPARAKALDDIDATVGIYDFVESGGAPLYFNSEGKNAINGSVVFVPFEYAQLKIDNIQDVVTAIGEILDEDDTEEVFYNLQGVRVENPDKGIYIRVKGNKTEKILK